MAKKKKKLSTTKLLTGEHIKELDKRVNPKYAYGALFKNVDDQMRNMYPNGGRYQDGGGKGVKPRRGVRQNPDGTVSTHLMRREYVPGEGWVAFPSLYQDEQGNWIDMGEKYGDDWEPIYEYAKTTGEVYNFGEDEQAAINFADSGSWKKQAPIVNYIGLSSNEGARAAGQPAGRIRYQDGDIVLPEQVRPGSARLRELQEMERRRQPYLAQQERLKSTGLELTPVSVGTLDPAKFSLEMIPEGAEVLYQIPAESDIEGITDPRVGIEIFSDPLTGRDYLTGVADPGDVPEYEVIDPYEDIRSTPLVEEKVYRDIPGLGTVYGYQEQADQPLVFTDKEGKFQYRTDEPMRTGEERVDVAVQQYLEGLPERPKKAVEPLQTSTSFIKPRPQTFYTTETGERIQAPEGAVWDETKGVMRDPKTGIVYNPRTGKAIHTEYGPERGTDSLVSAKEAGVPVFGGGGEQREKYYTTLGQVLRNTFANGGEQDIEELLTEEKITELEENKNVASNAEVEDGEYVRFPDGTVQKAYGEKHSNGGIDMHIPDGTKIISNKRKLSKDEVKKLKKDFEIDLSTKNTYAEAIDKYVDKIGLRKLYDEQEELFEELDKVIKNSQSEGSSRINKEYLSKKIHQIETQKEAKEKLKTDLFDRIFTMQEVGKRLEESKDIEQFFEDGGISRDAFKKVVNKYGLSEREGIDLYNGNLPERLMRHGGEHKEKKGGHSMYPDGGEHKEPKTLQEVQQMYEAGELTREEANRYEVELANIENVPPIVFKTTTGRHEFSNPDIYAREEQHASEAAFGKITKENLPNVLNNLHRNFPDIVAEELGVKYNEDGTVSFDENINFAQASEKVKNFQKRAQKRMEDTANVILLNPDAFDPQYVENAKQYLETETFDESLARGLDAKFGQFTAGRFSLGLDIVTPEEKELLNTKGIFTTKQLQDAIDSGDVNISENSLRRLEKIQELTPEGTDPDFAIDTIVPTTPAGEPVAETPAESTDPTKGIEDDIVLSEKQYPRLFMTPDQTPLPPSAMEAHLMGNIRLQRIDPTRIGVETELQQASDAVKEGTAALAHLPPNQRAAAIVGLQTNVQKGINEAIHKANIINAQNQASAELFNIGQATQEEQLKLNNLLSFEQRQLTAKAKTEEEVRNYYDQLNRIAVNNFRNQQDLNLLQTLAPNFSLSPTGMEVEYVEDGWKIQDRSKMRDVGVGVQSAADTQKMEQGGKYKKLFY